jgi:hypothetical protein
MKAWRKSLKRKYTRDGRRPGRPLKPRFRPWLEPLEQRIEPAPVWHSFAVPEPSVPPGGSMDKVEFHRRLESKSPTLLATQ